MLTRGDLEMVAKALRHTLRLDGLAGAPIPEHWYRMVEDVATYLKEHDNPQVDVDRFVRAVTRDPYYARKPLPTAKN